MPVSICVFDDQKYQVLLKAEELNNVTMLQPGDLDTFEWIFKV